MELILGSWRFAIEQVDPSVEELSRKYNAAAPGWHRSIERMGFIDAYRSLFSQIQIGGQNSRMSVLDIGIGTGGLSQALLDSEDRPVDLTGIDISAEMLEQARLNLSGRVASGQYSRQDIQRLNFADNQFDLTMGAHVLEHLADMRLGLSEMIRVTKPGAPILLIITRRGVASSWLHLLWKIRAVRPREIQSIFIEAGLKEVNFVKFKNSLWCNRMSIAIVGLKPL